MIRLVVTALSVNILCLGISLAKDTGQWGHDPETSEWFRSLHNDYGMSCCDYADGVRIEDPEWFDAGGGDYAVFARDKWQTVSKDRVLKGSNRIGYAILWWPLGTEMPTCFLPGGRG